ncbi:MAG: PAS domain S-box protein [Burkholderiaceae bacterium]|nr:PAS domain S-box protein [Burkholderiaceae bacterium]
MPNTSPPRKRARPSATGNGANDGRARGAGAGDEPRTATSFPIVGIGASAGGLAAFEAFFAAMSPHAATGMAFVLVQHLSPDHKSILAELVQRYTRMTVREAAEDMAVEPDCIYIIPPGYDLAFRDGRLRLSSHAPGRGVHLTVDHFFRSLAAAQRERAICVILSGAGSDGSLGLRDVKGEGGLVIAQTPETAECDGMPRSAIATGMVDYVLPPAAIPARIFAYVRYAFDPKRTSDAGPSRDGALQKMCALLRTRTGHDFSHYKETTLVRRIDRRMALHQITRSDDYLRHARENPAEIDALFRDLLIGVTSFFRDPEAFAALQEKVIRPLLSRKSPHEPVRAWICGCSTGEEAYSIAILLYEQALELDRSLEIQIFATDIDRNAIARARSGVFPASIAADVSRERLVRHFMQDPGSSTYRIQKHIRDLLVFSEQDVIRDPPFSRLDLISCRNLLIYLNADIQKKLIPLFHHALAPDGALFLGTSETAGEAVRLFRVVDRKWKLYARLPDEAGHARPVLTEFVPPLFDIQQRRTDPPAAGAEREQSNLRRITEQALLAHYAQTGVLVDARGRILHIFGRSGRFLEPADGDAALNLLPMAREGLRRELTIALPRAVATKQPVAHSGLRVKSNGGYIPVDLVVRPVEASAGAATLYLVVLEEAAERAQAAADGDAPAAGQASHITALEQELRSKEEYLQTTLEEMETTQEELKSTNEEMQSVNEELQSANEELETSKEELQSVNEELSTVNAELQDKVSDLSRANNDMNNLLASTGVGTLLIDHQLRIVRFTPAATQVVNLIAGDIGRPLEHVSTNVVGYEHMIDDIRSVLDSLVAKEAEVQVKGGAWYLMRIRPYRTMENLIEGAVVTLIDISERKKAEESLRRSEARLNAFIRQAYAGVGETNLDGRYLFVNDRFCEMLGYTRDELLQRRLHEITEPEDLPRVLACMQGLAQGGPDQKIDHRYVHRNGSRVTVHDRISVIRDTAGRPASLLILSVDVPDS